MVVLIAFVIAVLASTTVQHIAVWALGLKRKTKASYFVEAVVFAYIFSIASVVVNLLESATATLVMIAVGIVVHYVVDVLIDRFLAKLRSNQQS